LGVVWEQRPTKTSKENAEVSVMPPLISSSGYDPEPLLPLMGFLKLLSIGNDCGPDI